MSAMTVAVITGPEMKDFAVDEGLSNFSETEQIQAYETAFGTTLKI
nr:hypothetical protein [uncultured Cupriavidus sp.]